MSPHPSEGPGLDPEIAKQRFSDVFESVEITSAIDFEEFKHFLDHLPVAVIILRRLNGELLIAYANAAFEALMGCSDAEIRGKGCSVLDAFHHEDDPAVTLGATLLANDEAAGTFSLERPRHVLVEVYSGVIQDENAQEKYRIAALVDVTERARAQREEFARQIRDKDLLLKEIQHRVKNNLQLITALIRLEARTERGGDKPSLDRLAGRIESLQFLYQSLSSARPGEDIDLGQYLSQIAAGVMRAHAIEGIRLDVKVEPSPVSINVAMPVGLAVNELLTNAFKYAFIGKDGGIITLECLREEPDHYRVSVADNGVGLPPGVTWPTEGKLGTLIMQTLRENAKTEMTVDSADGAGTRVTIRFGYRGAELKAA
jgi:PAS domain S-box-containing protein